MTTAVAVPSLDELAAKRELVEQLPLDTLRARARDAAMLAADLQVTLLARLTKDGAATNSDTSEMLLDLHEAAGRLRISPDTLYSKWKRLPFAFKDPLDGRLKFRASGIERYIAARTARSTG